MILRDTFIGRAWRELKNRHKEIRCPAVVVETISNCNRRCSYCPNHTMTRGKNFMPEAVFEKLLEDLKAMRFKGHVIPTFYGEPLLDTRLDSWVARIRRELPSARIHLYTNGDLLTEGRLMALLGAGLDLVVITEHETGPWIPQRRIAEVVKARRELVRKIRFQRFDEESTLLNRGGLVAVKKACGRTTCDPAPVIDHEGNVFLCCNDYLGTVRFGNVRERPLGEIWLQPDFLRLRGRLLRGKFDLPICRRCSGINGE
jgi:MoaA/NifB/PqqE/SkfB family radical SAM enzyme